jgi:hypothetical protein
VEAAIARLTRYGTAGGSDRRPLPVDLQASERAAEIGNTVATWAREVAESRGLPVPSPARAAGPVCQARSWSRGGWTCGHGSCGSIRHRPAGVAVAATWLLEHLEWLRHQRQAAEAYDELNDAANRLKSLVGGPLPRWYAGQCWEVVPFCAYHQAPAISCDCPALDPTDLRRCEVDLYAAPGARTVRCTACRTDHDAAHRKEWLLGEARDTLAHAALLAAALTALDVPVAVGTVYSWASRGRIVAHGWDALGRPLYLVGEAIDLLARTSRRVA